MHVERDTNRWAQQTFGECELGDERRTHRLVDLASRLSSNIGEAPSSACRGDVAANEGAYRWIRNGGVEPEAIACGGYKRCAQLAGESEELLAVEDTTTVSYGHEGSRELGDVGGKERSKKRGFMVHSVILLEERSGTTVGLIEQTRWCREKGSRGKRHKRKERAYEDKESFKWERASRRVTARLGEVMGRVISVCDREADVYEYLGYKTRCDERYVVRSSWDRRVKGEWRRLNEELANAPKLGEETVKVEQRGGRRARTAQLELRACRVRLRAPKRLGGAGEIEVNAVLAQEYEVPEGENGLCWLLLSSESIESLSAVRRVLRIYRMRWRVEEFHKAWKSGAGVEQRRMRGADNLERIAVVLAFVAVRLLQLREVFVPPAWMHAEGVVEANEKRAKSPCTEILSESEWKTLWMAQERTRPPSEAPTLGWAYESLGKLGGWINSKRNGRVGWEAMWQGWFRLQERLDTYLARQKLSGAIQIRSKVRPGVEEAAVVARKDPMLDEVPVIFVLPADGPANAGCELETQILSACRAELADFKVPRAVHFVEDFPRSTLEKIAKAELRKQLADSQP